MSPKPLLPSLPDVKERGGVTFRGAAMKTETPLRSSTASIRKKKFKKKLINIFSRKAKTNLYTKLKDMKEQMYIC